MKRRFLVIVRAGDRSLHPQWLAQHEARNWDLVVHYHGDDAQRFPAAGDGVVRIDGKGPKWAALQSLLHATHDAWRGYDAIWLPDDDVAARGADIDRMFDLMPALGIELAQPSLADGSHADHVLARHNPNFAVRFSSFVETWAPCFSRALLERAVATFGTSPDGAGLGHVWPRLLSNPAAQCAILDGVKVSRPRPQGGTRHDDEAAALARHGVQGAIHLSYGALDRDGRRFNLFDPASGEFVFRLCDGYADTLAQDPAALGTLFGTHAAARREVLSETGARTAAAAAPAPARAAAAPAQPASSLRIAAPAADAGGSEAVNRFKQAVAAAAANPAGRVLA